MVYSNLHFHITIYHQSKNRNLEAETGAEAMEGCCLMACFPWLSFLFVLFQDRVSLCSPAYSRTHSIDQAGLELRNLPASAFQVLGLKACATTAGLNPHYLFQLFNEMKIVNCTKRLHHRQHFQFFPNISRTTQLSLNCFEFQHLIVVHYFLL